jgi:dihydrofolate reductase
MKISIVVAASENLVIGYKNALPWRISEDLKHFKQITINHSVVMGRKTFESIGKPLKERRNIVVSRDGTLKIEGAEVVNSLDEAIHRTKNENEIFINRR